MWLRTNRTIIAFVLYSGVNKVHALNISSIQSSTIDRMKVISLIKKLQKVPGSDRYTGRILYRILKTYCPSAVRTMYRTYFKVGITKYALINYGLNKPESFKDFELEGDKLQYNEAKRLFLAKTLNLFLDKKSVAPGPNPVLHTLARPPIAKNTEAETPAPTIGTTTPNTAKPGTAKPAPPTNNNDLEGFT